MRATRHPPARHHAPSPSQRPARRSRGPHPELERLPRAPHPAGPAARVTPPGSPRSWGWSRHEAAQGNARRATQTPWGPCAVAPRCSLGPQQAWVQTRQPPAQGAAKAPRRRHGTAGAQVPPVGRTPEKEVGVPRSGHRVLARPSGQAERP